MPSTQIIKKMENGGQKSLLFYPISDYPYHSKTKPLKTSFFFFKKPPREREIPCRLLHFTSLESCFRRGVRFQRFFPEILRVMT